MSCASSSCANAKDVDGSAVNTNESSDWLDNDVEQTEDWGEDAVVSLEDNSYKRVGIENGLIDIQLARCYSTEGSQCCIGSREVGFGKVVAISIHDMKLGLYFLRV